MIRIQGYVVNFEKMFKKLRRKTIFLKKIYLKKNNKIVVPEDIFSQLGFLMVNFCHTPDAFASYLSYFHLCGSGTRIQF